MHTLAWLVVAASLFIAAFKMLTHRLAAVRWWWLIAAAVLGAVVGTLIDAL